MEGKYKEVLKQMAAEEYIKGDITFSEAAHSAGISLWEMEKYLVNNGFKSDYSIEDIERELRNLK